MAIYLVIAAKKYKFEDEKTKEVKSGMHVTYLDPVMREDSSTQIGDLPLKVPSIDGVFDKLTALPGFYELDFRQRPGANNKPILTLASAKLVCPVEFESPA